MTPAFGIDAVHLHQMGEVCTLSSCRPSCYAPCLAKGIELVYEDDARAFCFACMNSP
jgi:hypothetical protein